MHVEQRVDEEPAIEIGGIAADLSAREIELAEDVLVVEIAVHEAAQGSKHQNVAGRHQIARAEVQPHLVVNGL